MVIFGSPIMSEFSNVLSTRNIFTFNKCETFSKLKTNILNKTFKLSKYGNIELHITVRLLMLIVFVLGASTACAGFILVLLK